MTDWIKAARLRTLPLSLSGIIMGAFIAKWRLYGEGGTWDWKILALALLVTLLYQILSNYANDYGDGVKGTDAKRINEAEARAVASGKITAKQMKTAVILFAALSFIATIALLYVAFIPNYMNEFYIFIGLGVASILAAIGYTVGKKPYGYMGLGDIFVFIFFGLVSVCGSYFLFTKTFSWDILLPGTAVGMMSMAVLNLNNMRDIESDRLSGKNSFALRIGFKNAMIYEMVLLQLPLLLILVFLGMNGFMQQQNYYVFIVMILLFPLSKLRRKILSVKEPKELDQYLKQVGIMTFVMAVLTAVGLNLFK
ncbi:1,4-dihydroxy-2-naphthoate octaprenyltransferase [Chryseobacterium bernardetii]|jgi:1,4-dihydroxy-2-naphthoate octaprenyltransferase|uniref:1,4-dihydroxy-2-naphthoate octaprenyltransferase n=3 Tax=Chryseobacterium TaxID=59732 RepID=A0A543EJT6_9FLAO|nr:MULTISPECIES: 1,4-dihydroxy-2-naphthoate octaprenyltransferase [Chryseobacterium]MDR6370243.1 1,4-dihydroxy-2-naphthoate octaprenyltransferase [Chryseobacterium vietnamense]MDR6440514.1 1,4-dihydroxy-2-naphthoate octaprenyltransferase [Chryseobacterium bernardetii]MDR6458308.1 1,4-dihydroxy-2-naphthoate octaprenyltransferase [Chryseobacterium vietnamense]MDR6486920.1 1,4-dihydroxy-2-naphthoate octaprenyltransferase [Chryseobacterium vietnamense]TQM21857.1 1,4-dihydroxy-2-naphthoate prenyltr